MKQIKVCFCLALSNQWLGGANYFDNLLSSIHCHELDRITPIVVLPHDAPDSIKYTFSKFKVLYSPFLSAKPFFKILHKLLLCLFGKNVFLEKLLLSHGVDMLSHFNPVGHMISMPFLPWIPDFQHLHLPHMFRARDRKARDRNMSYWLNQYPFILLSSYSAAKDMCSWSFSNCHKSRVLQFVSAKMLKTIDSSSSDILPLYNIDKPFFIVPNQYWRHKNHSVLIKALGYLLRLSEDVLVVSTGCTNDYRDPNYFLEFCKLLDFEKVGESYLILGEIPYEHLSILMRESLALINPSLFEGWSTTVEEAKSLGKQVILSDIAVHREQSPSRAFFFDPHDHLRLAEYMSCIMKDYSLDDEILSARTEANNFSTSYAQFAKNYSDIVQECYTLYSNVQ